MASKTGTKRPAHRPMKGEERMEHKISALFSTSERDKLDDLRKEKKWEWSTLVRTAMEMFYEKETGKALLQKSK